MTQAKKWTKEEIKEMLQRNDKAVLRALVVIFSLQTDAERSSEETVEHNGVGFNGADAEICSSLAKQIIRRGTLSQKQMEIARKKIMKYARQLTLVSNGEIKVKVIESAA